MSGMKNGIRRRGETYEAKVYVGRDATTGRKRYVSRSFRTKREAEAWRVERLKELHDTGDVFTPTSLSVGEYLGRWLKSLEGQRSPATLSDYEVAVRKHIAPAIGDLRLPALTPPRLQAFYDRARAEKSSRVMRSIHYTLSSALTRAVKQGFIRDNPCSKVDAPKHRPREMMPLRPEEATRFLTAAHETRLYPLWLLACTTGLRRGELCGLRWVDVDIEAGRLSVRQQLVVVGGHNVFREPKTRSSSAAVPLVPEAIDALKAWRETQGVERGVAGPEWQDHGLVFCQANGKPLHPNNLLKRDFRGLLAVAGIAPETRIHDLRHTVATLLFAAGVHPKLASALLRHSRASITQDLYTHLLPGLAEQAVTHLRAVIPGAEWQESGRTENRPQDHSETDS